MTSRHIALSALLFLLPLSASAAAPAGVLRKETLTLYVAGSKVGTLGATDERTKDGNLRLTRTAAMSVARGKETLTLGSTTVVDVKEDLTPIGYTYTRDDGTGVPYRAEGRVTCPTPDNCTLTVTTMLHRNTDRHVVPMPKGTMLATAVEVHARRNLKEGASWKGPVLVEDAGAIKNGRYTVTQKGNTFVVDSWMDELNSLDTLNAAGLTIKSEVPALNGIAVPVGSPAPVPGAKPLDVYAASTWTGPRLPANVNVVRFELTAAQGDDSPLPSDRRQTVLETSAKKITVEVRRVPKGPAEALTDVERQRALSATPYEPLQDARLRQAARDARGSASKPKDIVRNVVLWVHDYVEQKDLSRAYAPATATLESRQGDCTEHSVLASALLKANGVPARLVDGVIAFDGKLGYHEWVEAYVEGEGWTPVDPTFGEPEAGPNRLKFITGTSDPSDLMSMGLSAAQAFRGLKVTITGHEPR